METVELKETKRTDLLLVDPRRIVVREGFNARKSFEGIEELMFSILENGLRMPLRGFKDGEVMYLTDGERRLRAINMALELGYDIPFVEFRTEPKGYSEEKRVFDLLLCNDGMKLLPIEEADVYQRLANFHYKPEEIAKRVGKSLSYVQNMLKIANSPKELQDLIATEQISATAATSIIAHTSDSNEQVQLAKEAVEVAKVEGKKATNRHITKKEIAEKVNRKVVMDYLTDLYETLDKEKISNEKTELLYNMIASMKRKEGKNKIAELFV